MNWLNVVLPIVTLLVGACVTFVAESIRHKRTRRESLEDALRQQRADSYIAFLGAAHSAAHTLGRLSKDCPDPLPHDGHNWWLLDSEVAHALRTLELVGGEDVVAAARTLRQGLRGFRIAVRNGASYNSDEYRAAYQPVRESREALVAAARTEISPLR